MKNNLIISLLFIISFSYLAKAEEPCEYTIFDYNQFDLTRIVPIGNALLKNDIIYLTENFNNQSGAAWKNTTIDITGGFSTSFTFEFRNGDNQLNYDGSLPGGDGLAFVIAGEPYQVGTYGAGIGYNGLKNSVAIEFDTYRNNAETTDPNGNHVAVQVTDKNNLLTSKHTELSTLYMNDSLMILKDFIKYKVRIDYSTKLKKLQVYLDTIDIPTKLCVDLSNVDLTKYLLNPKACFVGITGATGVAVANQYLHSWQFCQKAIPMSVEEDQILDKDLIYDEIIIYNELGEKINSYHNKTINDTKLTLINDTPYFIFVRNGTVTTFNKLIFR